MDCTVSLSLSVNDGVNAGLRAATPIDPVKVLAKAEDTSVMRQTPAGVASYDEP